MRKLDEYLTESAREYVYRIKVAGELEKEIYEKFKAALDKFSVKDCTKPKKTPIQSDPVGFPGLENQEVNIFDITLEYPASTQQVLELGKFCGINADSLVVIDKAFNDSMAKELEGIEHGETRLEKEDYPEDTKEHKDASDSYADSYQEAASTFAGEADTDFEIAGKKTPPAKYSTVDKEGLDSPMTKVKRLSIKDILK